MPSKYLARNFQKGGTYHIFNKGIEGKTIFQDKEDYDLFLYYLYIYLTPVEKVLRSYRDLPVRLFKKNKASAVDLIAYCIMPDHFHLLLEQKTNLGISSFMKQLSNAYTEYFNKKYQRSGGLFEGTFKSVALKNDNQITQMSRFIHLNPVIAHLSDDAHYPWSSYTEYIDEATRKLCNTKLILAQFPSLYTYKKFVHDQKDYARKLSEIKDVIIDPRCA